MLQCLCCWPLLVQLNYTKLQKWLIYLFIYIAEECWTFSSSALLFPQFRMGLFELCSLQQRFSIPVSAYFVCYSYRFRCLFYSNVSALRSGHHRIFLHDSSSKRTYIFHSKCIEVCETWIKIVYIYRGIWCHTRPCVKTLRSANPWMNVPK